MQKILLITIPLLLTACSQEAMLAYSTPSYAKGYHEGCQTGTAEASNISRTVVRDEKLYANDREYRNGWDAAKARCDSRFETTFPTAGGTSVYDSSGVVGGGGHSDFAGGQYP